MLSTTNNLGEINFNSSLLNNINKIPSIDEYKDKIISLIEPILQSRFKNSPKSQLRVHHDRIAFACPYCGDSMQNNYAKRGNIILEGKFRNFYKCFNCDEFKRVDLFLKDFNTKIEIDVINYISDNIDDFSSTKSKFNISVLLDVTEIENLSIERDIIKKQYNLIEVDNCKINNWLKQRLQFNNIKFLYNNEQNYLVILNLCKSGKILGFQKRYFKNYMSKYETFNISRIYKDLNIDKNIPDNINIFSQLFGLFSINYNIPVTIFEGPFDSFLYKNSIANLGANKSFPLEMPRRYWYDDDIIGRKKSIELLQDGYSVFLWSKFKKFMELPIRKKWDLNDVMIWLKNNNKTIPNFGDFFSEDKFDIIHI